MDIRDIIKIITTRNIVVALMLYVFLKISYKTVFKPPQRIVTDTILAFQEGESFSDSSDATLDHADFRYSELYDNDTTILYKKSRLDYFSRNDKMDLMELIVRGKNLLNARAEFTVRRANKDLIYSVSAPARTALCPKYFTDVVDVEKAMLQEIDHFFDNGNMLHPAINETEAFDPRLHPNKAVYNELHYHLDWNGFIYNSFNKHEQRVKIVFSREMNRVCIYYRCCSLDGDVKRIDN